MTVAALLDSGQRIGRYQPLRRLAVGGMAEIYLARLPGVGIEGFEKLLVLKRILPQHALDPELLRMFLDEARLSATLNHANVVEVHDVGTDGEAPFFAMEYVHGANVREILRQHARAATRDDARPDVPLPLGHAVAIVAAAAAGLHYAHECLGPGGQPLGIVHRDVSPSNVLVSYDGAVKVSDFGIAKWAFQRTRTQEGTLKGKFAYMSPEQCRGRSVDARSDVFALGAILYELTTGRPAFSGDSDLDILNRIATGRADPPTWTREGDPSAGEYPPALAAIVMRALAPDPADRFPTMGALQAALDDFARVAGLSVSAGALAAFMRELFADDIVAWQAAEKAGKSLAEHLATPSAAARPVDPTDRTATDAFGPTRLRSRTRARTPRAIALVGFLALSAVGGGWMAKRWQRTPASAPPASSVVVKTSTTPVPLPAARPEMAPSPRPAVAITSARTAPEATAPPSKSRGAKTRRRRADAAPVAASRPTADARLGAWDPDSPVPP
jgi:tRNA A-37 threonylcarbamoyl transferase component Bud32